ncbi:hypothetical protein SAMN05428969_3428 [Devosia sp. YR412]|uniref:SGNH/GDSL hydrolase family protein n=1 Tax=Devosia sp. YR412 TaxID=1881030 RepID=UPI0008D86C6D|nr:hypothetical protein [Devosia sp. YR412]SEQ53738.1 hypothetical protein SAMN05428969_3428 [Devosia sp. YR412]
MSRTVFALTFFLLSCVASSAVEWTTVTVSITEVTVNGQVVSAIPSGTQIVVEDCFSNKCFVEWDGIAGIILSDGLMTDINGASVAVKDARNVQFLNAQNRPKVSNNVAAWGDSLTLGQNVGEGNDYPTQASKLFDDVTEVANLGIGGQTSTQIAARSGAPLLVTVLGDKIPANGTAVIVTKNVNLLMAGGKNTGSMEGTLCAVQGTMTTDSGGNWSFSPSSPGVEVSCSGSQRFDSSLSKEMRPRITWFWMGRNMADNGHDIAEDIAGAVAALGHDRFLVGGLFAGRGGKSSFYESVNEQLKAQYEGQFIDIFAALVTLGGDGSEEDKADIADGFLPRSIFQGDGVHLTAKGYAIVAQAFYEATIANEMVLPSAP